MAELDADEFDAWSAFLGAHSRIVRALDRELVAAESLTLGQYEVLLRLARAPEGAIRMTQLADEVFLSPSGVTRMVDQLEQRGFIERRVCDTDRRGYLALLTPEGRAKLRHASETHVAGIREHFVSKVSRGRLGSLGSLLSRLND
jgi:DNA-binding MarR family transcriptional regulator